MKYRVYLTGRAGQTLSVLISSEAIVEAINNEEFEGLGSWFLGKSG
jgi:hypothetical protein